MQFYLYKRFSCMFEDYFYKFHKIILFPFKLSICLFSEFELWINPRNLIDQFHVYTEAVVFSLSSCYADFVPLREEMRSWNLQNTAFRFCLQCQQHPDIFLDLGLYNCLTVRKRMCLSNTHCQKQPEVMDILDINWFTCRPALIYKKLARPEWAPVSEVMVLSGSYYRSDD